MTEQSRREFLVHSAGGAAAALSAMAILPDLAWASSSPARAPITLGLVGAGRQGRAILGELQKMENVQVAGVCDSDDTRLRASQRRIQGAEAFTDHKALLAKDTIQGIIIATPTHLHTQIALDAIQAGKHIYCEAPLAHTVEDCRRIAAAAQGARTIFAVGLEGRSNPVYKLARTFYRSDAVREAIAVEAQNFQKTSWRFPASTPDREAELNWRLYPAISLGLAGELGVHQFDVIHWYTDSYPAAISGHGGIRFHDDGRKVADTIHCDLHMDGIGPGMLARYTASLGNSHGGRYELFRGANAAIKLAWSHGWMFKEADAPTQGWEVYANRQQFHNDEGITLIADATQLASQGKLKEGVGLPHPSVYYSLWDFVNSIASGTPAVCDAAAGARSTIVAILAARAVAERTRVEVDPALLRSIS
jgi:predicted dehydrogenase